MYCTGGDFVEICFICSGGIDFFLSEDICKIIFCHFLCQIEFFHASFEDNFFIILIPFKIKFKYFLISIEKRNGISNFFTFCFHFKNKERHIHFLISTEADWKIYQ